METLEQVEKSLKHFGGKAQIWKKKKRGPKENYPPIKLNDSNYNGTQLLFANNSISTTKYNFLTFLPKFLWEQFRKTTNFYFLLVCIITLIPEISPLSPWTSVPGLLFVLGVAGIREVYEDVLRFREDLKVNGRKFQILKPGGNGNFEDRTSQDLKVGDLVYLHSDDTIPADIVLLASAGEDGTSYVETAQLDGETNLKLRRPIAESNIPFAELSSIRGTVFVEPPNHHIYTFEGRLEIEGADEAKSLGDLQLLLRGTSLRNTEWVVGIAVYCGADTKLALNQKLPPSKFSSLDKQLNNVVIGIFLFKITLCFFLAIFGGVWESQEAGDQYVDTDPQDSPGVVGLKLFFSYFAILSYLIPLSLVVTLEVVKVFQARWMEWDSEMAMDPENISETSMVAKTSNLNDELGLVQYVFSDKTGTLTENRMEFQQASIHGIVYNNASNGGLTTYFQEFDSNSVNVIEYVRLMSLCHSVVPSQGYNGEMIYKAASPDEEALVKAAAQNDYVFLRRGNDGICIRAQGKEEIYPLLAELEFSSDRRRMSVVIDTPDGRTIMYIKGADSIIYDRLRPTPDMDSEEARIKEKTSQDLEYFSKEGLRTLCLAKRELSREEREQFRREFNDANTSTSGNRAELVEEVADRWERDFVLIGATAIEDKLQEGVPDTIAYLLKAGIKVWVITGDKQATAINIGYSTRLLQPHMLRMEINANSADECAEKLIRAVQTLDSEPGAVPAMIIDGNTLKWALNEHAEHFLNLGRRCHSVICCRVTPIQKARIVNLIKTSPNPELANVQGDIITLSIGDGANDVSMIQEAHIGIGIFGNEGTQAARAADFAIRQFKHLRKLLTVHGRYSLLRNSILIQYSFYKNAAVFLVQFWFSLFSAASAQTLYDDYMMTFFNITVTSLPPFLYAIFEKDVEEDIIQKFPEVYRRLQKGDAFTVKSLMHWLWSALWVSVVLWWGAFFIYENDTLDEDGKITGLDAMGNYTMTAGVLIIMLRLALETHQWNVLVHLGLWGSILCYFVTLIAESYVIEYIPDQYGQVGIIFSCASFWWWLILSMVMALVPDMLWKYLKRQYIPSDWEILQEVFVKGNRVVAKVQV